MTNFEIWLVAIVLFGAMAVTFSLRRPSRRKNEGVNIQAEANDPELVGPVTITCDIQYPGARQYEGGKAIVRYDTTYSGGGRKVSKWILSSDRSYLHQSGHDVLYEYLREDGSLEHDRLVSPAPSLGGGVYVKQRLRFFDGQSQLTHEHYLREDGTLGLVSDHRSGLFQRYRLDGQRLHSEYFSEVGKGQRSVYYRLDGKTVWMEKDENENARVYFDLDGNAVDLRFIRQRIGGSFSMGPESEPVLTWYDRYLRPDGTLDYEQAWYSRFDKATDMLADTLGAVVFYDQAGNKLAEYKLDLRAASKPRFIQEVVIHNANKTTLVRKYRSPGCRLSEDVLDEQQRVIEHKDFGVKDRFQEEVKGIVFQGFIHNVRGTYDDESSDI
jgi:hypothetical protein